MSCGVEYLSPVDPPDRSGRGIIEQMKLIQQLDDEDKQTIFRLIEKMLINKKSKDFFQKNVAA